MKQSASLPVANCQPILELLLPAFVLLRSNDCPWELRYTALLGRADIYQDHTVGIPLKQVVKFRSSDVFNLLRRKASVCSFELLVLCNKQEAQVPPLY